MAQVIIMSKRYKERPSKIVGIDDVYLAYCFDEAALYLETEATDSNGVFKPDRIRWSNNQSSGNKDMIAFIQKQNGGGKIVI